MNTDLISYYRKRAEEYEKIYSKPERQEDIRESVKLLQELFKDKEVLEIACGTGFWTQFIARTATSILATDINKEVLDLAEKKISDPRVVFEVADLYKFNAGRKFQSLFGGFIWSHIPKQELRHFFRTLNNLVSENGTIVLMDNSYVEGSNHPITGTDEYGNTYQTRKLDDGSLHKVLKNFATEPFLRKELEGMATELDFIQLDYFWILSYKSLAQKQEA